LIYHGLNLFVVNHNVRSMHWRRVSTALVPHPPPGQL